MEIKKGTVASDRKISEEREAKAPRVAKGEKAGEKIYNSGCVYSERKKFLFREFNINKETLGLNFAPRSERKREKGVLIFPW